MFEPGNKVYYPELDQYYAETESFKDKGYSFTSLLVPEFRVGSFKVEPSHTRNESQQQRYSCLLQRDRL